MPDYSLVPVDHQPDFSDASLVPVDYDPFSAEGGAQPSRIQMAQTQTQAEQPRPENLPQQPEPSIINAVRGVFNPSLDEDKKIVSGIYNAAKDAFLAPGTLMQPNPYPAGSEEASWYDDQRQKATIPAAINIATMFAGLGLPTAERGAVGAFGGKLPPPTSAASVAEKLDRYLLNPDHIDGGWKANWFRQALGFTRENAAELAKQLVFDQTQASWRASTQYGTHFNQTINVTGANGRTIPVITGWTVGPDGVPRLATVLPRSE